MGRVVYGAAARRDLSAILEYIARASGSPAIARRLVDRLRSRIRRLGSAPGEFGRSRPELQPLMRSIPFGNYVIFFRYEADTIFIVNILEGHRDIDAFFDRSDN